eukprot:3727752-Amphidinium_carterae.1
MLSLLAGVLAVRDEAVAQLLAQTAASKLPGYHGKADAMEALGIKTVADIKGPGGALPSATSLRHQTSELQAQLNITADSAVQLISYARGAVWKTCFGATQLNNATYQS